MADITTIKRMLADRAEDVAFNLLPAGKKQSGEWKAGSVDGDKGDSLNVCLRGVKAGIWADFATGEGGDLLDLWQKARRVSLTEAMNQAREFLGVKAPEFQHKPRREFKRPPKLATEQRECQALRYMVEKRCVPLTSLQAYRVDLKDDRITFPFFLPDGEMALAKCRKAGDGEQPIPVAKECEPVLFGWQAIPEKARTVVICEGEIDALSWHVYGYPAMSVPFGGGAGNKQAWIESEFERLERFETIYLALDDDAVGDAGANEIVSRLGMHRCLRVKLPQKDMNACLQARIPLDVIAEAIKGAKPYSPDGLSRAMDYRDKVFNLFYPKEGQHVGYIAPYGSLNGKLRFRPAEVTLWSGATGHGKSQVLSDCTVEWLKQGSRVCVASLEMQPQQTLKRMIKQAGNVDRPTEPYFDAVMQYLDRGLYLYSLVGKSSVEKILGVFDYARAKYGCDQFIIDSFMRLGIPQDDYNAQEKAMYEIVDWAITHNVHLHLVAHARKGQAGALPDTAEVKGAQEITANAFNVITVWRDKKQEELIKNGEAVEDSRPTVILNVDKQRNGDFTGKVGMWFNLQTYQYRSTQCPKDGRNYIQFDNRKENV